MTTPTVLTAEEHALIQRLREKASAGVESQERAEHLVVIRESSKKAIRADSDFPEFEKMAQQILDRADVRNLEGAGAVRALAGDIVRNDARAREIRDHLGAETIYDGRITVGHSVRVGQVIYVLAVFSAAKTKMTVADDLVSIENAFSNAIARIVYANRVKELHTGPFHRLVRHGEASKQLASNLKAVRTIVRFAGGDLDMSEDAGQNMWDMQVMMAEAQYKGTVASLTNGSHAMLETGLWPKSESQLPAAGYRFRSETDATVVPDLDSLEMIRDLIRWAAEPSLSELDIAKKLADRYAYGSGVLRSRGAGETIMDARYPDTAVRNLLRKGLPLWKAGRYEYRIDIPQHLGNRNLRSNTLDRVEETDKGRVAVFDLDFHHDELPDGRWIDEETLDAAIALRLDRRSDKAAKQPSGRAASNGPRKPLAGIAEWIEGDRQLRMSARHRTHYRIVSRDAAKARDAEGQPLGWQAEDYRTIEAAILPAELHRKLADAVIDGLADGVAWSRTRGAAPAIDVDGTAARIAELTSKVEKADQDIANAEQDLQLAREIGATETMKDRLGAIERLRRDKAAVQEEIARTQGALADLRELAEGAKADAGHIAALFAKLATCTNTADHDLNLRLTDTLVDMTARISDDRMSIDVSTRIKIPTSDGQLIVGPVTCRVGNRRRLGPDARGNAIFEKVFRDGMSVEDAAADCGYTDMEAARRKVREALEATGVVPTKGLRTAVLTAPDPDIRRVIWAEVEARRSGRAFRKPTGMTGSYAHHLRDTYTAQTAWPLMWAEEDDRRQELIDAVAENGDAGYRWVDLTARFAMPKHIAHDLTIGTSREGRTGWEPLLERDQLWHRHNADRKVYARRCPHCSKRTLTRILRAPEVPGGLICTSCRRTADGPSTLRMPESYV